MKSSTALAKSAACRAKHGTIEVTYLADILHLLRIGSRPVFSEAELHRCQLISMRQISPLSCDQSRLQRSPCHVWGGRQSLKLQLPWTAESREYSLCMFQILPVSPPSRKPPRTLAQLHIQGLGLVKISSITSRPRQLGARSASVVSCSGLRPGKCPCFVKALCGKVYTTSKPFRG